MQSQVVVNGGAFGRPFGASDLPRAAYTCSGSICTGNTAEIAGIFAGLQRSLNALAAGVAGMSSVRVTVDGKIGPETVGAVKKTLPALFPQQPIPQDSMTVAQMAPALADMFFSRAAVVADYSPPSVVSHERDSNGLPVPLPAEDQTTVAKKGVHWGWWLAGGVLLVGIGYLGYRWVSGGRGLAGSDYGEATDDFIDV